MRENAKNGHVDNQYDLYQALTNGWNGEAVNATEANTWLAKAAAGGHLEAKSKLAATVIYHNQSPLLNTIDLIALRYLLLNMENRLA
jgi:TPR repeat protein